MSIVFQNLNKIEFKDDEGLKYFTKTGSDSEVEVKVEYVPVEISKWSSDRFDIYLFENAYLNAENDVYEININGIDERFGWIFPITILESNENDYVKFKNLNNYKYVAYEKLLSLNLEFAGDDYKEFYTLRDFFPECCVCLLCKDVSGKIAEFDFDDYLLSFYNYGYLLLNLDKRTIAKPIFDRSDFVSKMRGLEWKKIVINKANFKIKENAFTLSLYNEHLLQSESHLIRFIFLYQVVEYLMQLEFDGKFSQHLKDYQDKKLGKNDLKEELINASRERDLISSIFNRCAVKQDLQTSFDDQCGLLFDKIGRRRKPNPTFSDTIYDLRNLITHTLRDLTDYDDQLKKIVEIFERLITNLLINYSPA